MIHLTESKTKRVHSFLEYISSGTKLHCTFAIDFTGIDNLKSNKSNYIYFNSKVFFFL